MHGPGRFLGLTSRDDWYKTELNRTGHAKYIRHAGEIHGAFAGSFDWPQ